MRQNFSFDEEVANDPQEPLEPEDPTVRVLFPLRDVVTRWSSTRNVLARGLKIRKGLDATTTERDLRGSEIVDEEWILIKEAVDFLDPFALTTQFLEGIKYPTLGAVIPLITKLVIFLKTWIDDPGHSTESRDGARNAKIKIEKYYERFNDVYLISTVLDPRLKLQYFTSGVEWKTDDENQPVDIINDYVKPA